MHIGQDYESTRQELRQLLAADFDEAYLLTTQGTKRQIFFTEKLAFEAKSRVFDMPKVEGITMDQLATAYLAGKTIIPQSITDSIFSRLPAKKSFDE